MQARLDEMNDDILCQGSQHVHLNTCPSCQVHALKDVPQY